MMANTMTPNTTVIRWYPVPTSEEKNILCTGGRNTSPWTCFHPYSSPKSCSWNLIETKRKFNRWMIATHLPRTRRRLSYITVICFTLFIFIACIRASVSTNEKFYSTINSPVNRPFLRLCCSVDNPCVACASKSSTPDRPKTAPS